MSTQQERHAAALPPGPRTGVRGLDEVLGGGLKPGALHLVRGSAGTGKTVLAHQLAFAVTRRGERVLYFTAPVESHQTLIDQARTFRYFDASAITTTLHYVSLQPALERGGVTEVRREMFQLMARHTPALVVVDGVQAFELFSSTPQEYHRLLVELQAQAAATGIAVLLLSSVTAPAETWLSVPDVVLELRFRSRNRRRLRTIEVLKFRGRAFLEGSHTFVLDDDGMRVLPRLEASVARDYRAMSHARDMLEFGIAALDQMLGGGVTAGSITLLSGAPGTGKTLLGLNFLSHGAAGGAPGMLVGFHESPDRITEKAEGIGLPFGRQIAEGTVAVQWQPSAEIVPDRVALDTAETVRRRGIRRLVIDGLDDLMRGFGDPERGLGFLNAFLHLLRGEQVGVLMTEDIRRVFSREIVIPIENISAAVDNILLLRYAERDGHLRRFISILKLREHDYENTVREFMIRGDGCHLGERFDSGSWDATGRTGSRSRRSR